MDEGHYSRKLELFVSGGLLGWLDLLQEPYLTSLLLQVSLVRSQSTVHASCITVLKCFGMLPVWFSFIALEPVSVLDSSVIHHHTCMALYHSSGFFIISQGLHLSALVFFTSLQQVVSICWFLYVANGFQGNTLVGHEEKLIITHNYDAIITLIICGYLLCVMYWKFPGKDPYHTALFSQAPHAWLAWAYSSTMWACQILFIVHLYILRQ